MGYSGSQQLFKDVKSGMQLKEDKHHTFSQFLRG